VKFLANRRRKPWVATALLAMALLVVGGGYAAVSSTAPAEAAMGSQTQVEEGKRLFLEGCSSCHGLQAEGTMNGPSLIGVGAASVHFQVATGRMPMSAPGAQAPAKEVIYTEEEIAAMSAWVASLAPGPGNPHRRTTRLLRRRRC
jgi:ubiquinol-cytochrome c reductase cytochrome c subunit